MIDKDSGILKEWVRYLPMRYTTIFYNSKFNTPNVDVISRKHQTTNYTLQKSNKPISKLKR